MTTFTATEIQEQDETDLARQALDDIEAFAELYRRHVTRVYRYHIVHVGNAKDEEDLTSRSMIRITVNARLISNRSGISMDIMMMAACSMF